jgi:hypothetical protein
MPVVKPILCVLALLTGIAASGAAMFILWIAVKVCEGG